MDSDVKNKIQKLEDKIDDFYDTYIIYKTNKYKIIDKQNKRISKLEDRVNDIIDDKLDELHIYLQKKIIKLEEDFKTLELNVTNIYSIIDKQNKRINKLEEK